MEKDEGRGYRVVEDGFEHRGFEVSREVELKS